MKKWYLFDGKEPEDGQVVYVAFRKGAESYSKQEVKLCMYTPNYIVPLCEEDEGQWKGLGTYHCDRAWAWMHGIPEYPKDIIDEEEKDD